MRFSIYSHEYRDHPHNTTIRNERAVEVVLAERFLAEFNHPQVLEIGAVTPYYIERSHVVADPFDDHPRVTIKARAEEIDYTGRDVLSISTLEHIGESEGSARDGAWPVVERLVRDCRNCLITWPVGLNPGLDQAARTVQDQLMLMFYVKVAYPAGLIWEIHSQGWGYQYPSPRFGWAESVVVLTKFAGRAA